MIEENVCGGKYEKYKFLCSEKTIGIICIVACIVAILFEFVGEKVHGYEDIAYCVFRFCAQISYSIIASVVFYFFTGYIRDVRKKALFKKTIEGKKESIQNAMDRMLKIFFDSNYVLPQNITEEKLLKCCEEIRFNDSCGVCGE